MILSMMDFMYGNLCRDKLTGEFLEAIQIGKPECKDYIGFCVLNRSKFPLPDGWQAEPIELSFNFLIKHNILSQYIFVLNMLITDEDFIAGITYLHQFQNLYMLLTGNFLNIKI